MISAKVESDLFDLADDYLMKRKVEIENISNLVEKSDFQAIETIGHKIQGNADLFGLSALALTARTLEDLAKVRDSQKLIELSKEILHYLNQVEFVQDI